MYEGCNLDETWFSLRQQMITYFYMKRGKEKHQKGTGLITAQKLGQSCL
jgi:hypothetical protein